MTHDSISIALTFFVREPKFNYAQWSSRILPKVGSRGVAKYPQPPKGTDELECFIKDIQRELIGKILPHNDTKKQERTNFSIDPRCNEKPKRHKPSNYPNRQNKLI